jgi:small basic protein (TIGR04137 family)
MAWAVLLDEHVRSWAMSLHSSLRTGGALVEKRSVLTRAERVTKLLQEKKMPKDEKKALGLPKVRVF